MLLVQRRRPALRLAVWVVRGLFPLSQHALQHDQQAPQTNTAIT